jgi:hypothetical protein
VTAYLLRACSALLTVLCFSVASQVLGAERLRKPCEPIVSFGGVPTATGYVALSVGTTLDQFELRGVLPIVDGKLESDGMTTCRFRVSHQLSFRNDNTPTGELHEHRQDSKDSGADVSVYLLELPVGEVELEVVGIRSKSQPAFEVGLRRPSFHRSILVRPSQVTYLGEFLFASAGAAKHGGFVPFNRFAVRVSDKSTRDRALLQRVFPQPDDLFGEKMMIALTQTGDIRK